ncbi:SCO family protein [Halobacillus sp. BBL2006]|uniref:SCO family protein n=1 Tax=Halobacillus sp. BBL2006 TaxID=1543706 RepID=UPI0005420FC4|nr:SCO family protein [Halobacillus sp. BBL2006]KHE68532.1 cysteine ABC transporter ATP-binding protein [Halobacillus sp. BBL2006]
MKAWKYAFILLLLMIAACGQKIETNMSEEVQSFNFTTQDGNKLSNEDLEGQWWVANTIFTSCETVCPPMTRNMSILQDKAEEEGLDVQLVSFSIDPETDTPEKLKEYGNKFGADYKNWTFLTGYDFQTIKEFSIKSFKSLVDEIPDSDQYMHGTSFFLVNPEGEVIKKYKGTSDEEMQKIVNDLKKVM